MHFINNQVLEFVKYAEEIISVKSAIADGSPCHAQISVP